MESDPNMNNPDFALDFDLSMFMSDETATTQSSTGNGTPSLSFEDTPSVDQLWANLFTDSESFFPARDSNLLDPRPSGSMLSIQSWPVYPDGTIGNCYGVDTFDLDALTALLTTPSLGLQPMPNFDDLSLLTALPDGFASPQTLPELHNPLPTPASITTQTTQEPRRPRVERLNQVSDEVSSQQPSSTPEPPVVRTRSAKGKQKATADAPVDEQLSTPVSSSEGNGESSPQTGKPARKTRTRTNVKWQQMSLFTPPTANEPTPEITTGSRRKNKFLAQDVDSFTKPKQLIEFPKPPEPKGEDEPRHVVFARVREAFRRQAIANREYAEAKYIPGLYLIRLRERGKHQQAWSVGKIDNARLSTYSMFSGPYKGVVRTVRGKEDVKPFSEKLVRDLLAAKEVVHIANFDPSSLPRIVGPNIPRLSRLKLV